MTTTSPGKYAQNTQVSEGQTREQIIKALRKYGATKHYFGVDEERGVARVAFEMRGRKLRFDLTLPPISQFATDRYNRPRNDETIRKYWDQAIRSHWRALLLVIKAKMEAVEVGIVTFDEEFLAHIIMPDASTVGEWAVPQLNYMQERGMMPKALPGMPGEYVGKLPMSNQILLTSGENQDD